MSLHTLLIEKTFQDASTVQSQLNHKKFQGASLGKSIAKRVVGFLESQFYCKTGKSL